MNAAETTTCGHFAGCDACSERGDRIVDLLLGAREDLEDAMREVRSLETARRRLQARVDVYRHVPAWVVVVCDAVAGWGR